MFEVLEKRVCLAVTVAVDGAVRYQTMDGFGSSVRVFDDPHVFENFNPATGRAATVLTAAQQGEVLDRLYRDLKLNPRSAGQRGNRGRRRHRTGQRQRRPERHRPQ